VDAHGRDPAYAEGVKEFVMPWWLCPEIFVATMILLGTVTLAWVGLDLYLEGLLLDWLRAL